MRSSGLVWALATCLFVSCANESPVDEDEVEDLMETHVVPGLSMAIIDDYELAWTGAYGVVEAGTHRAVTGETLFQTASIGKSVTAMTALNQVRSGLIDLDHDVSDYLTSWALPESDFTDSSPVTVRTLLSHTAGVNVPGFVGYLPESDLPTLHQILDGVPPANNDPILVDAEPGTYRYSGGGYEIVQQILEDVTDVAFAELVGETIFEPLGMRSAVYDPLPESQWPDVAIGHRSDERPVQGGWHSYPEHGAGPFWTTASDFALFANEVMLAYTGRSDTVITQDLAVEMLTPVDAGYALGLGVTDDGANRLHAIHEGGNEGYETLLVLYPERGEGVVFMTNSDNGLDLAWDLVDSLSLHFKWVRGVILSPWETVAVVAIGLALFGLAVGIWRRRTARTRND